MKKSAKNLIEGLIKELVSPVVEVDDEYPSSEEMKLQNKYFRINKMEEEWALQFLRKKVLKYAVELFQIQYKHELRYKKEPLNFTPEQISKNLKKVSEERYNGKRKRDYITYSAPLIYEYKLDFLIFKSDTGCLVIQCRNPITTLFKSFVIKNFDELTPLYESHIDPSSNKEKDKFDISKIEESFALNYLRRKLLPAIINEYNHRLKWYRDLESHKKFVTITNIPETIKSLKKVRDIQMHNNVPSRRIQYKTISPKSIEFVFEIQKIRPHVVSIDYFDPLINNWRLYELIPRMSGDGLAYSNLINEGMGFPESTNLRISKQEEDYILQYLRNQAFTVDKTYKKTVRKIKHDKFNNPYISDKIQYQGTYDDGHKGIISIRKNIDGKFVYFPVGPDGELQTIHPIPLITEGVATLQQQKTITKQEEDYAFQMIKNSLTNHYVRRWNSNDAHEDNEITKEDLNKNIKKRDVIHWVKGGIKEITYKVEPNHFFMISRSPTGNIRIGYYDNWTKTQQWFSIRTGCEIEPIRENIDQPNLHISKEEEMWALERLKRRKNNVGDPIGRYLKKIKHHVSDDPKYPDQVVYKNTQNNTTYTLQKDRWGKLGYKAGYINAIKNKSLDPRSFPDEYTSTEIDPLEENNYPNVKKIEISKKEELEALNYIRNEIFPLTLKKIKNTVSYMTPEKLRKTLRKFDVKDYINDRGRSVHKIVYMAGDSLNSIFYFIEKDEDNKLSAGFSTSSGDVWLFDIRKPINGPVMSLVSFRQSIAGKYSSTILENTSTGDWNGWDNITKTERDRLKLVLQGWIKYVTSIYHPHLASTRTFLAQKCFDNLDTTDPRFAAKPLAHLSMEDRSSLMDYIDHKDTTGQSSMVMRFLIDLSRQYMEPPKSRKVDITLPDIVQVQSGKWSGKGDVKISGLEDMRPVISFADYPYYELDNDFVKQYSKPGAILYVDMGQGIKITNMEEVMIKVKTSLSQWYDGNLDESIKENEFPPQNISKEEELRAVQVLKNYKIDGYRLGRTLKKVNHFKTTDPDTTDQIYYSAYVGYIRHIFLLRKRSDLGVIIRDTTTDKWIQVPGIKENLFENIPLNELPITHITKKEEDWAFHFIKNLVIDGERLGKTLKKTYIHRTAEPYNTDIIYYSAFVNRKDRVYRVYKDSENGKLYVRDAEECKTYHIPFQNTLEENKPGINTKYAVLTKEDEDRAVQFIKNLEEGDVKLGKTLKKVKIHKTATSNLSDSVYYDATLPDGSIISFEIFRSLRRGLLIVDRSKYRTYNLDFDPNDTKPFEENTTKNDKSFLHISKQEEHWVIKELGNYKDDLGNRFGKYMKKYYDDIDPETKQHTIKYRSSTPEGTMIFILTKTEDNYIIARTSYGSIFKIIKLPN